MNEFISALPIIISLIVIEGLLSIDNALIIATMAAHLPEDQRKKAVTVGILGAYVLRGLALVFAATLIANPWLKVLGSLYLVYLMFSNLGGTKHDAQHQAGKSDFWMTVINIELVDLTFALDNIVTAVALSNQLWVLITGVFIGMAAMRLMSNVFVGLVEKYPILKSAAYLLVGYIGADVLLEEFYHFGHAAYVKFIAIAVILGASLLYERMPGVQKFLRPLLNWLQDGMGRVAGLVQWVFVPLQVLFQWVLVPFKTLWRWIKSKR
jgi:tellurite resistance protein TerC